MRHRAFTHLRQRLITTEYGKPVWIAVVTACTNNLTAVNATQESNRPAWCQDKIH